MGEGAQCFRKKKTQQSLNSPLRFLILLKKDIAYTNNMVWVATRGDSQESPEDIWTTLEIVHGEKWNYETYCEI